MFRLLLLTLSLQSVFGLTWIGNFSTFSTWKIQASNLSSNRAVVKDPLGSNEMVLQVKYLKGSYWTNNVSGGTQFYIPMFEDKPHGHASFEFDVLFPNGFEYAKGGKLPGLYGGRYGCSGGYSATDCFSGRFMWGDPPGSGYCYLYIPKNAPHSTEFCNLTGNSGCTQPFGFGIAGRLGYFASGKWNRIKETIKLNTPGVANGELTVYVNGQQFFTYNKIIFRTSNNVPINGIMFETFFGGSTPDWQSPKDQFIYFKNLRYDVL